MAYESDPVAAKLNELFCDRVGFWAFVEFDDLNPAEKALAGVWELVQEVYNGGFMQLFQNSSGERVHEICDILRQTGADQAASILERAIALAGPNIPWKDLVGRFEALKRVPEQNKVQLFDLGREFYDQLDDIHRLLWRYLSECRGEIDVADDFWTEFKSQ